MLITAAVVSWNTRELLLRCLDSLAPAVRAGSMDVRVIDNGSSDGSSQAAREHAPWAQVLEAGENLGFGRAVNLAAGGSDSKWLLVCNADIALEPGAINALLAGGDFAQTGCVAPRLILPDGATQHSVHPFPTVPFTLGFSLGLQHLNPRLSDRLCLEGFWDPERARAVPWAIGACLLVRRRAFDDIGGFDERQWMYAEDLDLAWRLRDAGWITRYQPSARVRHESGAATLEAFGEERTIRFLSATYEMLWRRRGGIRMSATAALNIAGAAVRAAWMAPLALLSGRWRGPETENRRWLIAHLRGAYRGWRASTATPGASKLERLP
jgi:GT2 family glycosyltransferase